MAKERKQFSRDFKIKVVLAYDSGVSAAELARQFEVHPNVIYNWSKEYHKDPDKAFTSSVSSSSFSSDAAERRIAELERMLGRMALENDFLKKALTSAKDILAKGKLGSTKP